MHDMCRKKTCTIFNTGNHYKRLCMLKYGQLLTVSLHSLNINGMGMCSNSSFIVIPIVSNAKDFILGRNEQILVCMDSSKAMSRNLH